MKCTEFKEVKSNTLQGFATLQMDSGLIIKECALHSKDGSEWVGLPSKPQIDKDGNARRDDNGKIRYTPMVEFVSKEIGQKWS